MTTERLGPPWARLEGFKSWTPPQRCPYCLEAASVQQEALEAIVVIQGCPCAAQGVLRVSEALARRRWRQLGVR